MDFSAKGECSVRSAVAKPIYAAMALIVAGCAEASSQQVAQSPPDTNQRPGNIVVYYLAMDRPDVTLN
jgi:hypothetical protein